MGAFLRAETCLIDTLSPSPSDFYNSTIGAGGSNKTLQTYEASAMEPPSGLEAERLAAKLLYTCDSARSQKFVTKPRQPLVVYTNAERTLGMVDLETCLEEIFRCSPELADVAHGESDADYTIYSLDFSEEDTPLQGHGRLSQMTAEPQWITGQIYTSPMGQRMLEAELHLAPHIPRAMKRPAPGARDLARREYSAPALTLSSSDEITGSLPSSSTMSPPMLHNVPPSSPPALHGSQSHAPHHVHGFNHPARRWPAPAGQPAFFAPYATMKSVSRPQKVGASPSHVRHSSMRLSLDDLSYGSVASRSDTQPDLHHKDARSLSGNNIRCYNCSVTKTSNWRRIALEDSKEVVFCNACGLWYRSKKSMRPKGLWEKQKLRRPEYWDHPSPGGTPTPADPPSGPTLGSATTSPIDDQFSPEPSTPPAAESPVDTPVDNTTHSLDLPSTHVPDLTTDEPTSDPGSELSSKVLQDTSANRIAESTNTLKKASDETNKENEPPVDVADLLFTPRRRPDQFTGGSGSTKRWMSRYIHTRSEDDVFEAFLQSPSKRANPSNLDLHMHQLHVEMASSGPPSSPPNTTTLHYDDDDDDDVTQSTEWILQSPSPSHKRTRLV